ncbi:ATP-binding protein [Peptostreptococcus anaerobius]|nr:ATP-binding protein [Peptostreptococcus anaerobius]
MVENTGVTIHDDKIKNVFVPFYRVDSSRNKDTGSSGLGLYLVSELLKKQGCRYDIYCKENSTVFIVDIKAYNKSNNDYI